MAQAVSPEGVFTPYSPPPVLGSPGTQLFSYTAIKIGAASIAFKYFRCSDAQPLLLKTNVKSFAAGFPNDFCQRNFPQRA